MIECDWYGLYREGWTGISQEAFSHPAKFSAGLIKRIYAHCLAQGYFQAGDLILDPFGGVALGGRDAMQNGLSWLGVELEEKFVNLGRENIALWEKLAERAAAWGLGGWGTAQLIQGDSRYLTQMLRQAAGVVSSPPYVNSMSSESNDIDWEKCKPDYPGRQFHSDRIRMLDKNHSERRYSANPANLGNLPPGTPPAGIVSSPPYAESHTGAGDNPYVSVPSGQLGDARTGHLVGKKSGNYGDTPGQLGAMRVSRVVSLVSSPPYAESIASDDPDKRKGLFRDPKRHNDKTLTAEYGESEGQLGKMRVVSSPPWEQSLNNKPSTQMLEGSGGRMGTSCKTDEYYGSTDGQLGNSAGSDFWSASSLIMAEVAQLLEPGAVAVWVVKAFVRDKQIVNFPAQWAALGEAHGFETIEWIRAWLVEDRGGQYTLEGELEQKQVKRCSFFRRLYESKYPGNSIDWEDVIIQRRNHGKDED